jgi:hypothetical protein
VTRVSIQNGREPKFLNEFQQYLAAFQAAEKAIELKPYDSSGHLEKAYSLRGLKSLDSSYIAMRVAVCLSPSNEDLLQGLGTLRLDLGDFKGFIWSNEKWALANPANVEARCAKFYALMVYRRIEEAKKELDHLVALDADHISVRNAQAEYELAQGNYDQGWAHFEWRWKTQDRQKAKIYHDAPLWLGEPLDGKTLVVYPEIGFGDFLMFSRYFEFLRTFCANLILIVPDTLYRLYESQHYPFPLVRESAPVPLHDLQCPIMSLPLALKDYVARIPSQTPYLTLKSHHKGTWDELLGKCNSYRIGLAWSGHQSRDIDLCPARQRSIPLPLLTPILDCQDQFHCLQKEFVGTDLPLLAKETRIVRHHSRIADFLDTAGLIDSMDLIISIDTSIAHLAGALGKEVWVLLPFSTDYRWEQRASRNDWYPNARLFRQKSPGDWLPVIQAVRVALEEKIQKG